MNNIFCIFVIEWFSEIFYYIPIDNYMYWPPDNTSASFPLLAIMRIKG
jgi:hypothetical protein